MKTLTFQDGWSDVCSVTEGSEDTALTASTKTWASISAASTFVKLPSTANAVEIRFRSSTSTATAATFYLYAIRGIDDATSVCYSTDLATGITSATKGGYYIKSFTLAEQKWIKTVSTIDNDGDTTSAGDDISSIGRIVFDACGYGKLVPLITSITDATGTATISVDMAIF
jgi:hypothetical protein